jgi:hypothetical protein
MIKECKIAGLEGNENGLTKVTSGGTEGTQTLMLAINGVDEDVKDVVVAPAGQGSGRNRSRCRSQNKPSQQN